MNRELKFRAWDEKGGMVHNLLMHDHDDNVPELNYWLALMQRNAPLMQYTGLKDKNGKDIYSGDILEWSSRDTDNSIMRDNYVVKFKNGCFRIEGKKKSDWETFEEDKDTIKKQMKIIGNIYENPELL